MTQGRTGRDENIERIRKLRSDLEEGGMKKERLAIFDAMFGSYERKLKGAQDFQILRSMNFISALLLKSTN